MESRHQHAAGICETKDSLAHADITESLGHVGVPSKSFFHAKCDGAIHDGFGVHGQELFKSKGCIECHTGKLSLVPLLKRKTLTDIAVEMWNHQPRMAKVPPTLDQGEMRDLVSYLWAQEFFVDSGDAASGKRVFVAKHCTNCHNDPASGAPKLTGVQRSYSAVTMVSALWHHGPQMLQQMEAKNIQWPRLDGREMSDLIAYLNSQNGVK